ncbi:MAG: coenzyme F420-0:L-glutamate ligase [Anaerolineales bacterium]|nr:coenzyme F420-0:L-glutamate ligase [Anaerolineales bacterium]MCB0008298.1 coenzyme F420-0:L-glutamate ligase [Anaerolineales bacterium]MCB8961872.1 coenzyme F420-0:L-glutamate ligase [Ardenticatenales bacterium]
MKPLTVLPLPGIPLVQAGDDLAAFICDACARAGITLQADDILVLAQKIVSKAENCFVRLAEVTPSAQAEALAEQVNKDPRLVEVILGDSAEVIRARPGVLIVQHRLGFISANAGIDHSNVSQKDGEVVLRLPLDPDSSARRIRQQLGERLGVQPPVLIIDSHGRPWRVGTYGVVIGLAGLHPVQDLRGEPDLFDVPLQYTDVGFADQIAAAASLVMGQAAEGCPAVVLRGLEFAVDETASVADGLREKSKDLFR